MSRCQRNLDRNAGMIGAFTQEITASIPELISKWLYAVTRVKRWYARISKPVVSASTKDRGDQVEIRIRDNGTGIAPEVMEKR